MQFRLIALRLAQAPEAEQPLLLMRVPLRDKWPQALESLRLQRRIQIQAQPDRALHDQRELFGRMTDFTLRFAALPGWPLLQRQLQIHGFDLEDYSSAEALCAMAAQYALTYHSATDAGYAGLIHFYHTIAGDRWVADQFERAPYGFDCVTTLKFRKSGGVLENFAVALPFMTLEFVGHLAD